MNHLNSLLAVCAFCLISLTAYTSAFQAWNGTNICCNGRVGDQTQGCCGANDSIIYNTTTRMCCGGRAMRIPKTNSQNYSCCSMSDTDPSATLYNYYTSVCCNGMIVDKAESKRDSNFGCCGMGSDTMLYDYSTSGCCGLPNNSRIFDTSKAICCNNKVVKNAKMQCCNDQWAYNPKKMVCVYNYKNGQSGAKLKPKKYKMSGVCGTKVYNMKKNACCPDRKGNQQLIKTKKFMKNPGCCTRMMNPYNSYNSDSSDSSDSSDNSDNYKTTPFDYNTQVCCDSGKVLSIPKKRSKYDNYQCCGSTVYNTNNQTCCNNQLYAQDLSSQGTCCENGYYSSPPGGFGHVCCNGGAVEQTADYSIGCCNGTTLYNSTRMMCCGNTLKKQKSMFNSCCLSQSGDSGELYDYRKYMCPMYSIVPNTNNQMNMHNQITKKCGPTFRPYIYYDF